MGFSPLRRRIGELVIVAGLAWLGCAAAASGATRPLPPGTVTPHVLPAVGATAAAAQPATWLVGARPGERASEVAALHGAQLVSGRGSSLSVRTCTDVGERSAYGGRVPLRRAQPARAPAAGDAGADEFAATDWRTFLLSSTLVPPPVDQAPLTAVIDAAADATHPELAGVRVIGDPTVSDAHGTAVASVIAGHANGLGMVGVYPGAPLLSVGSDLTVADVVRAIDRAVQAGARVINMSYGAPQYSYAEHVELAYAVSQNVLPVAAAGNDYLTQLADGTTNPVMFPAALPHVMSVSSMGPSGASSSFSTANGAVDVAAPGEGVLAAVPPALDTDGLPDGYQRLDGTSFAAPIVSGAAAWLLAERPWLTAAQAGDLLRWSAQDLAPPGWDFDSGYGLIDLSAALADDDPPVDTLEVNDDIEWVNGRRFTRPDPLLFRARHRRRSVSAAVDRWKDPADVYRIQVPPPVGSA